MIICIINIREFYRKTAEKIAKAYFWLETEIEKRIKDSKDSEESKE